MGRRRSSRRDARGRRTPTPSEVGISRPSNSSPSAASTKPSPLESRHDTCVGHAVARCLQSVEPVCAAPAWARGVAGLGVTRSGCRPMTVSAVGELRGRTENSTTAATMATANNADETECSHPAARRLGWSSNALRGRASRLQRGDRLQPSARLVADDARRTGLAARSGGTSLCGPAVPTAKPVTCAGGRRQQVVQPERRHVQVAGDRRRGRKKSRSLVSVNVPSHQYGGPGMRRRAVPERTSARRAAVSHHRTSHGCGKPCISISRFGPRATANAPRKRASRPSPQAARMAQRPSLSTAATAACSILTRSRITGSSETRLDLQLQARRREQTPQALRAPRRRRAVHRHVGDASGSPRIPMPVPFLDRPAGRDGVPARLLARRVRAARRARRPHRARLHAGCGDRLPHDDGLLPGRHHLAGRIRVRLRPDLHEHLPRPARRVHLHHRRRRGVRRADRAGSDGRRSRTTPTVRRVRCDTRIRQFVITTAMARRGRVLQHLPLGELGRPSAATRARSRRRGAGADRPRAARAGAGQRRAGAPRAGAHRRAGARKRRAGAAARNCSARRSNPLPTASSSSTATAKWRSATTASRRCGAFPHELLARRDDDELIGFVLEQLDDPQAFLAKVRELYQSDREDLDTLLFKDGRVFERYSRPLVRDGEVDGRVWSFRDISERKRFEAQLVHVANHDPLTGLFNRRRFDEELDRQLAEAQRYGVRGALLFLDLDQFKDVNDSRGHRAGDDLLTSLALLLRQRLRDTDVVARLGGDEFAVLLPHAGCRAGGRSREGSAGSDPRAHVRRRRARRWASRSASASRCSRSTAPARASCCRAPTWRCIARRRKAATGRACSRRRATGRRRSSRASAGTSASARRWTTTSSSCTRSRSSTCAPTASRSTSCCCAWSAPDGELIAPSVFLDIAERSGLIQDIDRWVVRRAIQLLGEHEAAGRELRLEVNLSGKAFADRELLPHDPGRACGIHGVEPGKPRARSDRDRGHREYRRRADVRAHAAGHRAAGSRSTTLASASRRSRSSSTCRSTT